MRAFLTCWLAAGGSWGAEDWAAGETDILFSEVHYHPAEDESAGEFVELYNSGVRWVDVGGWKLSGGVELTIPDGAVAPPNGFLVLARDAKALKASRKIENVVGDFKGSLSNTGDLLELRDRGGHLVTWFRFGDGGRDGGLWPDRADGGGSSLELLEPCADWHRAWYWASSRVPGGTPGGPNSKGAWGGEPWKSPDPDPELRINEARLDEAGPFVEIYNAGSSPQKLDGLKLTRHPLGEGGVSLSGTVAKRRHHVLNGEAVRPLCAGGGRLYLVRANSLELIDSLAVRKAVPKDGSFGRCPDGEGDTFTLAKATPGATNGKTPRSDLVINEILYRGRKEAPRAKDSADAADDAEFIEIHNRSRAAISLKGWKIERAVRFSFPDDAEIPAGGYVAVGANPEKLRARVPPEDAKHVFGPFKGKLSNAGDSIVLSDPAGDSLDRVPYLDRAPWPVGADGEGFSMELLHPDLDNRLGAAWTLGPQGGTPARKNARSVTNMSPVIASVLHSPAAPSSDEEIVIRADVVDNSSISEVVVVYRDLSGNSKPAKKALSDAGKEDDGDAKDGHYAVRLPRMRAGTLLGFYIQAKDSSGKTTRFPEGDGELCLQVEPPSKNDSGPRIPTYHVLMPPQQWERFERTNHFQDTKFPCTLVVTFDNRGPSSRGGLVFYDAKIRYRGNNSRRPPDGRMSYRIELARGDQFDGRDRIILNAYSSLIQKAAGDVFRLLGVAAPDVSVVRLKTPGIDDVHYVDVEVLNNEFLKRRFGGPPGPIFRGRMQRGRVAADLSYHGNDPSSYLGAYEPMNRRGTAGGAALVQVLEALATKDEKLYAQRIAQVIDVEEWAAYFAVNHVLMNDENGLSKGVADDFFIAQRPTDGKFILLAWDHDSLFTKMRYEPIYGPAVPAVRRLLVHPRVAPLYHGAIRRILDGPLAGDGALPRFAALREFFPSQEVASIEGFVASRQSQLRERYVLWPQASAGGKGEGGALSGFGTKTFLATPDGPEVLLTGIADPAVTFQVKAQGSIATYDAVSGRWSTSAPAASFSEGPNAFWVELLGPRDEVRGSFAIDVEKGKTVQRVPPEIHGEAEWKPGAGPYVLDGEVNIHPDATLTVQAGVDVICQPGSTLTVRGALHVEGSTESPVTFRASDASRSWAGIRFQGGGHGKPHRIAGARFEGGGASTGVAEAFITVQTSSLDCESSCFRGIQGSALVSDGGTLTVRSTRVTDGKWGIVARGGSLTVSDCELCRLSGGGLRAGGLESGAGAVRNSALRDVRGAAVVVEGGSLELQSVLVCGSPEAISLSQGARVQAKRLTLAMNGKGIVLDGQPRDPRKKAQAGGAARGAGSRIEVSESVLGVEAEHVSSLSAGQVAITRSIVAPAAAASRPLPTGDGVLRATPVFAAPLRGDFRLAAGSPGKGAGEGGADYGVGFYCK